MTAAAPAPAGTASLPWVRSASAVAVAVTGPLVRSWWLADSGLAPWWRAAAIAGLAAVATGLAGERRWWLRAALAAGVVLWVRGADGELVALWAGAGVALGDWAARRWSPAPGIPRPGPGVMVPVGLLVGLAAWQSWQWEPGNAPLFTMAGAVAVTGLDALSGGRLCRPFAAAAVATARAATVALRRLHQRHLAWAESVGAAKSPVARGPAPLWHHLPPRTAPPSRRDAAVRWVLAVGVASGVALARARWLADGVGDAFGRLTLVAAGASIATGILGERRWFLRLMLAVAAGVGVAGVDRTSTAVAVGLGVFVGDWAVRRWSPLPGVPRALAGAIAPAVVLTAVAAWRAWREVPGSLPAILMGVAAFATLVGVLSRGRLDAMAGGFGRRVGEAISWATFAGASVPLVLVPWGAGRLARVDVLAATSGLGGGWVPRRAGDVQPQRSWAPEATAVPVSWALRWKRIRRSAAAVVLLVPPAIGVRELWRSEVTDDGRTFAGFRLQPDAGEGPAFRPEDVIYRDEEWYETYRSEFGVAMSDYVWAPFNFWRMGDMSSTYVNIVNGDRRSWVPPECDCPTLVVWTYGGSTGFGFGQRDEHTISSYLARAAWDAGLRLEVVNRGTPGDVHWREGLRFAFDLTRSDPPDLAVFYDGVNDVWATHALNDIGRGDIDEPIDPVLRDIEGSVSRVIVNAKVDVPDGVTLPPPGTAPTMDSAAQGRLVIRRYDRARKVAMDAAKANGIAVEFFWQPNRLSRPPIPDEPQTPEGEKFARALDEALVAVIPPDVHDLTDVFDGNTDPMFTDDVHHDERAARIIGRAMFEDLESTLRLLAFKKGAGS